MNDDMSIHDVMSGDEIAEYERDGEYRLDAEDDARHAEEEQAEDGDEGPDGECVPELVDGVYVGCGSCAGCQEQRADEIEDDHEMGSITYDEAVTAHQVNGTWF